MKYRKLEGTDLTVPQYVLGTGDYASNVPADIARDLLKTYVDCGGTMLDTSHYYGSFLVGGRSLSECLVGDFLQENHLREQVLISTKGCCYATNKPYEKRVTPAFLRSDLTESLRNLHTDYIDFYWLHQDDPSQPVGAILEELNRCVEEGKIRYFGCSNWKIERILEADAYAEAHGLRKFSANQVMLNMAYPNMTAVDELIQTWLTPGMRKYHERTQRPVFAYCSQASGFFYNCFKDDYMENIGYSYSRKYFYNSESLRRAKQALRLSKQSGMTLQDIVLGYTLAQPFPVLPIVGPQRPDEMKSTLESAQVPLTQEQINFIFDI